MFPCWGKDMFPCHHISALFLSNSVWPPNWGDFNVVAEGNKLSPPPSHICADIVRSGMIPQSAKSRTAGRGRCPMVSCIGLGHGAPAPACCAWFSALRDHPTSHYLGTDVRGRGRQFVPLSYHIEITPNGGPYTVTQKEGWNMMAGKHVLPPARKHSDLENIK